MRITQDTFSYLPDFTEEQIAAQVRYCILNGWAVSVEHTDDPHPRNAYWDMWGLPMFDQTDVAAVMREIAKCREAFPDHYVRMNGYDSTKGRQTTTLSLMVNRPQPETEFELERTEGQDRRVQYTIRTKRRVVAMR